MATNAGQRTASMVMTALVGGLVAAAGVASAQTLTGLGFLPAGGTESYARDVSDYGSVVGYGFIPPENAPTTGFRAFGWTSGSGMVNLGTLGGGTYSVSRGVSADDSVVVGWSGAGAGNQARAFRWTVAGMQDLGVLPGYVHSFAYGVDDTGDVVVGRNNTNSSYFRAFRWDNITGMQDLGALAGHVSSVAYGVSGDGSVVVGYSRKTQENKRFAFRWTAGNGMKSIGKLKRGRFSEATAANINGSVVVGTSDSKNGARAFRWTAGRMTDLGTLNAYQFSYGMAVSADGSVVVGYSSDGSVEVLGGSGSNVSTGHAFLWSENLGMVDLNSYLPALGFDLTGWELREARAISANSSTIVGWGWHNGQPEAWIAQLP